MNKDIEIQFVNVIDVTELIKSDHKSAVTSYKKQPNVFEILFLIYEGFEEDLLGIRNTRRQRQRPIIQKKMASNA